MKGFCIKMSMLLLLAVLFETEVQAQEQDTVVKQKQLKEVVVTAEKQREQVQDIPASVSYLDNETLVDQHVRKVEDLKGLFPNLYLSQPGDGRNVIGIRGIVTSSYEPAVAVYVDGVLQYNLDTYFNNLQNVKRIEVLRGPQGTLYGRNAMGGVINIITKKPENRTTGYAGAEIGNYGFMRYKLGFQTPIISDKLFFGISGQYKKDNGYYENDYNQSSYDKKHAILGNYYLKYLTESNWVFRLNYKHSFVRNHGAFALSPSIEAAKENPYHLNQDAITKMVDNVSNASLSIRHEGNRLHFTSQTSFQSNYRIYEDPIDGDFSPIDAVSIVNNYGKDWNNVQVWTQEFRFHAPQDKEQIMSWTAGVFGFYANSPVKQGSHFGKDVGLAGMPAQPNTTMLSTNTEDDLGLAIFGQADIDLTRRLGLTIGLRYDWEHKELDGKSELLTEGNSPVVLHPDSSAEGSYHAISPKAIISYKLSPHNLLYLSYSKGFRAGGISAVGGEIAPLRKYDPEFSNSFELGVKNEFFDRSLKWNLDVFYVHVKDLQIPQLVISQSALTVTKNAGELRSMGIESELTSFVGKHFLLNWNAGITNAEFTNLSLPDDNENKDYSGNKQLYTPEYTSNLSLQYENSFGRSDVYKFHARAQWLWFGTTYFDMKNKLKQNPYSLCNANVGITKGHVSVGFWAKNIFNTLYVDYAYNFGAAHLGNPATFGVSVKATL